MKYLLNHLSIITFYGIILVFISSSIASGDLEEIKLGYHSQAGGTSLIAAINQGYFAEEGLKVIPIQYDLVTLNQSLQNGDILGAELDYHLFQFIANGAPIVLTAGLSSGFLEILGKTEPTFTLAVEALGSGPSVSAANYFRTKGLAPEKAISFLETPDPLKSVDSGQAQALARFAEANQLPPNTLEHSAKGTHTHHHPKPSSQKLPVLYSARASLPTHTDSKNPHAHHTAANHFFNSFVVLRTNLTQNPNTAASITRAWIRGAKWTGENLEEAANLAVQAGIPPTNILPELQRYMWMPGVKDAKIHALIYIHEGVSQGVLKVQDETTFFNQVFFPALPDIN
ncbi:MAG: hypothetical protein LBF22_04935 [Deltaproteobacteria bacterium]|jgi:ABC-type nitrate/sulfonate/bicarbonate transport system substrate-binding protein|nr:hypothetical protein [Deltaproteobacteria bacterium]